MSVEQNVCRSLDELLLRLEEEYQKGKMTSTVAIKKDKSEKEKAKYFEDGVSYDWQLTDDFNKLVKGFHGSHARQPGMKEAKRMHTGIITELQKKLKDMHACSKLEYVGSAYEGVRVGRETSGKQDDIEFDIMVFMEKIGEIEAEKIVSTPGYAFLKLADEAAQKSYNELYKGKKKKRKVKTKRTEKEEDHDDGCISASQVAGKFFGQLDKCIKECQNENSLNPELRQMFKEIKLRMHGPAVQMDVYIEEEKKEQLQEADNDDDDLEDAASNLIQIGDHQISDVQRPDDARRLNRSRSEVYRADSNPKLQLHHSVSDTGPIISQKRKMVKFYSVDMVPVYEIPVRKGTEIEWNMYVAKPVKNDEKLKLAWRISFSLKEKDLLSNMDKDNGCRKQVLRILKVIRNREPGLALLTSYHLKTILLRMMEKKEKELNWWKMDNIGLCLMECIKQLIFELDNKNIPNHFMPEINLLDGMKDITRECIKNRLKHMRNSRSLMDKILKHQKI